MNVTIRGPRFSQGGYGYVTADTLEITYAGHVLKNWKYPDLFSRVARLINMTGDGRAAAFAVTDYFKEV